MIYRWSDGGNAMPLRGSVSLCRTFQKQCGLPCTDKNDKYDTMYYDLVTKTVSELLFL